MIRLAVRLQIPLIQVFLGNFLQKARGLLHRDSGVAITRAHERMAQIQLVLRARDCDVKQPPFLF